MNRKLLINTLPVLLATTLLIIPFVNVAGLMSGSQSGKSFYFAFAVMALVIAGITSKLITRNDSIKIKPLDALIGLYFCYSVLHPWLFGYSIPSIIWIEAISLALFYLLVRQVSEKYLIELLLGVLLAGMAQAIYGNMQLYGFSPSNHGIFRMTGSFFNPGPYAGYLCAVLPVAVAIYFKSSIVKSFDCLKVRLFDRFSNSVASNLINGIALISIVSIVLVLPASRSRAAWLGALAGCFIVFQTFKPSNIFFKPFKHFIHLKKVLVIAGILLFAVALMGMYKFKQGSADGRLLIWKVSAGMIKDKPIFGHGGGKFAADYMNYQAAYFKPNPDVPEAMQADNVTYAYNEFLKLTVEKGTIGLLLALAVIWCLFFGDSSSQHGNPTLLVARGGLLSILVFALFSYPSDILPIRMLFVLFAAVVATHQSPIKLFQLPTQKTAFTGKVVWYSALAIVLITVYPASQYLTKQYQAYKTWKDASDIYNVAAYPECLEDFELAYPQLKTNGAFLVQYGKALEMAEKYESSISILNEAKPHLNNTILYTCLGNNYKALGNTTQAEQAYLYAWNMAPARFYPLYLLAKLYDETGQPQKAVEMAKKVMEKEVKVESTAVKEIQEEMRRIIKKGDAETLNESNIQTDNNLDPIYKGTKEGAYRSVVLTCGFKLQKW